MTIDEIGKILRQRRQLLGLTQLDVCQMTNINIRTLYEIENGRSNPSFSTMEKLAGILGLELKLQIKEIT